MTNARGREKEREPERGYSNSPQSDMSNVHWGGWEEWALCFWISVRLRESGTTILCVLERRKHLLTSTSLQVCDSISQGNKALSQGNQGTLPEWEMLVFKSVFRDVVSQMQVLRGCSLREAFPSYTQNISFTRGHFFLLPQSISSGLPWSFFKPLPPVPRLLSEVGTLPEISTQTTIPGRWGPSSNPWSVVHCLSIHS